MDDENEFDDYKGEVDLALSILEEILLLRQIPLPDEYRARIARLTELEIDRIQSQSESLSGSPAGKPGEVKEPE